VDRAFAARQLLLVHSIHWNNRWLIGLARWEKWPILWCYMSELLKQSYAKVLYPFTADVLRFPDQIYETQLNNDNMCDHQCYIIVCSLL